MNLISKKVFENAQYPDQSITGSTIGICMEVHRELGHGFLEVVYKDAIEYELRKRGIGFEREKKFQIIYKGVVLPHYYIADFVIADKVILEAKAVQGIHKEHYRQMINYLAVSKMKTGLIINLGEDSLKFKRVIL